MVFTTPPHGSTLPLGSFKGTYKGTIRVPLKGPERVITIWD